MANRPHRFPLGGYAKREMIPALPMFPRGEAVLPKPGRVAFKPTADALSFADMDRLASEVLRDVVQSIVAAAALEAAARSIALSLVQNYGVSHSLRALRTLPRPLRQLDQAILAKLEAVAVHLGSP